MVWARQQLLATAAFTCKNAIQLLILVTSMLYQNHRKWLVPNESQMTSPEDVAQTTLRYAIGKYQMI